MPIMQSVDYHVPRIVQNYTSIMFNHQWFWSFAFRTSMYVDRHLGRETDAVCFVMQSIMSISNNVSYSGSVIILS